MRLNSFIVLTGTAVMGLALPLTACGDFSANEEAAATGGVAASGGMEGASGGATGEGTGGMVEQPPPEVSCENVVACGGDVNGLWFAVDSCLTLSGILNLTSFGIGCTEGTVDGTLEVSGNFAINVDNSEIVTDTTQTFTGTEAPLTLYLGPECLDVSGTVVQCDSVAGPMKSIGFTEATCVPAASGDGGCDCDATVNQDTVPGFVTSETSDVALYTAEGNVLNVQGNATVDYDYCVQGDYMLATPKTVGNVGTAKGTILFRRQQ